MSSAAKKQKVSAVVGGATSADHNVGAGFEEGTGATFADTFGSPGNQYGLADVTSCTSDELLGKLFPVFGGEHGNAGRERGRVAAGEGLETRSVDK